MLDHDQQYGDFISLCLARRCYCWLAHSWDRLGGPNCHLNYQILLCLVSGLFDRKYSSVLCSEFCSKTEAKTSSRHSALLNFRNFLWFCNVNCLIIRTANVISYKRVDDRARRDCCDHFCLTYCITQARGIFIWTGTRLQRRQKIWSWFNHQIQRISQNTW